MGSRFPQPDNELAFEQLCLRLYRKLWKNEGLYLYGKRGQAQHGVDIHDQIGQRPLSAVQCKHHEPVKTISPVEIKGEVTKAENSHFSIERYVIATTARKSAEAQDCVAKLNQRSDKKFLVEIHFWEEICQYASEFGRVIAEFVIHGEHSLMDASPISKTEFPQFFETSGNQDLADTDEPYASIDRQIQERQLAVARHELNKLPSIDAAASLASEKRYKILRLHAKLHLESGEFELASALFLQAFAVCPDLAQARENQVLGYILANDQASAYQCAAKHVADGLETPVMILRLVDSISTLEQLETHWPKIGLFLDSDDGINISLSHKYLRFGEFEKACAAADKALSLALDSPQAQMAAAMAKHSGAVHGDASERRSRLQTSLHHYDVAESMVRAQNVMHLLPEALVNRGGVKSLLGDAVGAEADYRAAVNSSKEKANHAARAVSFFLQQDRFADARTFLSYLDRTTQVGRYLATVTECHDGNATQKRICFDEMLSLADEDWDRATECRFHCVQWALELNEIALAESCVSKPFQKMNPFQAYTMLSWIRLTAKSIPLAKEEADKALNQTIRSAYPQELRLLANILVKLKDDANAIGLLEQITTRGVFDDDMKSLIDCAQRLERHDLLLRLCAELREAGSKEEQLWKLELDLLSRYSPTAALEVANVFVAQSRTPAYFVASKNTLAVRLKQFDKVNLHPSALPAPSAISLSEADLVLGPYISFEKYDEALKFVYGQRRCYFDQEDAHGKYCCFILTYGDMTPLLAAPELVTDSCAVLLEVTGQELRWVIIEDAEPTVSRGEYSSTSLLSRSIIGYHVGDVVSLPSGSVKVEQATIREIQSKYRRVFHETIQNFQRYFPGTSVLQQVQVNVGHGDTFDPSAIIPTLKGRQVHVERNLEQYCTETCSLFLLSESIGLTEFNALKLLSQSPDRIVRCCHTTPHAFEQATSDGIPSGTIVLSISAITTIALLDGWKHLDTNKNYLISQLTSELIDSWLHQAQLNLSKEGGSLRVNAEDQLVFHESNAEQRKAYLEELLAIRRELDSRCTVVSSTSAAEMPPEQRKLYNNVIGIHNVEAAAVAKSHSGVLLADDVVVEFVATSFAVKTVWSQLAFRCFAATGALSLDEFDLITAKLASWNYTSVIWHPETIVAAGRAVSWDTTEPLFRDSILLIRNPSMDFSTKVFTVVDFLKRLRRSDCTELRQGAVIRAVLDALDEVPVVLGLFKMLNAIFGVDIPSAQFVGQEFGYWLHSKKIL